MIFQRTNQPSIALTEEWIVTQVADGDSITVRQTDGSQIEVELCGIDAPEMTQAQAPAQPFANEAKQKLLKHPDGNTTVALLFPLPCTWISAYQNPI
ncbi:thermonuclease family protein [Nostoc sp. DSM 114167]|uniref:thermonuclease family protein n=1 Tax=Nostoc sp. DSM 114167 TaxID=3439050 RepID=UPI004045D645